MRVQLGLGSNLGDRGANLRAALEGLNQLDRVQVTATSQCYETEPIGVAEQPPFWNMAAEIETDLDPLELLDAVKQLEAGLGRVPAERWGPRAIDIDIVLWGDRTFETDRLTVPHREFRNRAFVLIPLKEIAPRAVDPVTGETVEELGACPEVRGAVLRVVPLGH